MIAVTGASGSGKSTLVNDILFKRCYAQFYDSRVLSGEHDGIQGLEHIKDVIDIDQSPIGRTPRSNPATYIGFYDNIRTLFASVPESVERGYTASRFSFNVKGGRCEECAGDGTVTTHLGFMPDVEVQCDSCKGARYNQETLEIVYNGKTISDILNMSVEEGVSFFADQNPIVRKIRVLDELGLGYITLGQSATTLSGGEAQRIKLASELCKMRRGGSILYILDEPTTRTAPGRHRPPSGVYHAPGRLRSHCNSDRTPLGCDQDRRPCYRSWPGGGAQGWRGAVCRHAGGPPERAKIVYCKVLEGAYGGFSEELKCVMPN